MAKQMILRSEGEVIVEEFETVGEYMWNKLNGLDDQFVCMVSFSSWLELFLLSLFLTKRSTL